MTPSSQSQRVRTVHKWAFWLWAGLGIPVATVLTVVYHKSLIIILLINLVMSGYTILMQHALGMRQEDSD